MDIPHITPSLGPYRVHDRCDFVDESAASGHMSFSFLYNHMCICTCNIYVCIDLDRYLKIQVHLKITFIKFI